MFKQIKRVQYQTDIRGRYGVELYCGLQLILHINQRCVYLIGFFLTSNILDRMCYQTLI